MSVEVVDLRPGHSISRVIKGGWQLAGDHGSVDRAVAISDMEQFLDAGITTFDCADIYVGVEEMIGEFIASVRRQRGATAAERICVHTKLVPDLTLLERIRPSDVETIIDRSLKRLQVDCLDLVQFFWWDLSLGNPLEGLSTLIDLQIKGKIRNLGITNWDHHQIAPFVEAGFDIAAAQVQYSVLDRRPAKGLSDWAAKHDMQLVCYGTLAGGFLTENWLGKPDPGFQFENRSLIKYRLIIDEFGAWSRFQDLLQTLRSIGDRHGVSLSSVATRWVLDQPHVAAGIVGARYARHLPTTLEVFSFSLSEADHVEIKSILSKADGPDGKVFALEADRTGRHGSIMKYNLNTNPNDKVLGADG